MTHYSILRSKIQAYSFLFMVVLCSAFAKAQSPVTSNKQEISLIADSFYGVDDFNNLYYGKNNVIFKQQPDRNAKVMQYYDVQLGDLTSVDLINPLKIVLFYKDTQTVVFIDNRMNENLRIDLSQLKPYRYFDFVGLAGERRLWLFNTDADRLELYDYINGKLVLTSPVITSEVSQMTTDYNFAHLLTANGITSYNNYGSKVGALLEPAVIQIDYDFEKLVAWTGKGWKVYNFQKDYTFKEETLEWDIPLQDAPESFYLKNGKLYIYRHNILSVFTD